VGIFLPKFQPEYKGKIFADRLCVRGSAFWLKDPPILVTCAHVVESLATLPVELTGLLVIGNCGNYMRVAIGLLDFMHDLALLVPKDVNNEVLDRESGNGLEIADHYPKVGEEVEYAGFPLGFQLMDSSQAPSYANGVTSAQLRDEGIRKVIQITGSIAPGYSGSPVVTKRNPRKVIGIISNSPSKEAGDAQIFMAVSWEHLRVLSKLIIP
jgi:S1-C subfamily serine protease